MQQTEEQKRILEQAKVLIEAEKLREQEAGRGAIIDPIMQGASFGFADEIGAGIQSLGALFTDEEVGEAYEKALGRWRGDLDAFRERNPVWSFGAELGGALIPTILTLGASAPATAMGAARAGSVAGAAYGFGSGRGGLEERLTDAAWGAGAGAAGGAAGHGLTKAGGALLRKVAKGKRAGGARMVEKALERDDLTLDNAVARLERGKAAGVDMMVADVGEDNVRGLTRALGNTPGKARRAINRELTKRDAGQGERINNAFEVALGSLDEGLSNLEVVLADRARMASPLYKQAYATPFEITEGITKVLQKPSARSAMKRGKRLALDAGLDPENPVVMLDYTKRSLDDAIGLAVRQGQKQKARALLDIKSELIEPLKASNPAYREALESYASDSAMIDAFETGTKFLRGRESALELRSMLKGMTDGEKEFFRTGMLQELRRTVENAPDAADLVKRVFGSETKRNILKEAFPDKRSFNTFRASMLREAKMRQTRDAVQVGSRTAPLETDMTETAADAAYEGVTGNFGGVLRAMKDFVFKRDQDPEVAKIAADILTETDPAAVRAAMQPGQAFRSVPQAVGRETGLIAERGQNRVRRPLELTVTPTDR